MSIRIHFNGPQRARDNLVFAASVFSAPLLPPPILVWFGLTSASATIACIYYIVWLYFLFLPVVPRDDVTPAGTQDNSVVDP